MKHLIIVLTCLLVTAGCITVAELVIEQQCIEYAERLFPDQTHDQRELICEWLAGIGASTITEFCQRDPLGLSEFDQDLWQLMCQPGSRRKIGNASAELAVRLRYMP